MQVTEIFQCRAEVCREVLDDLPEWFGIPQTKADYVAASADMPMLCYRAEEEFAGFISVRIHTPFAAELYVLGVKRRFHRRGIGRAMIDAALNFGADRGLEYLTVKTIAPSHPDPHYAATRKFYEAVGFKPIEVFPTLWGAANPCVLMIRQL